MSDRLYELHASICQTLANPKRLEILSLLRDDERSVNDLAKSMGLSPSNVSQHLSLLRQKGVVVARREGATVYYGIASHKIIRACDLMREVLLEQLAAAGELAGNVANRNVQTHQEAV